MSSHAAPPAVVGRRLVAESKRPAHARRTGKPLRKARSLYERRPHNIQPLSRPLARPMTQGGSRTISEVTQALREQLSRGDFGKRVQEPVDAASAAAAAAAVMMEPVPALGRRFPTREYSEDGEFQTPRESLDAYGDGSAVGGGGETGADLGDAAVDRRDSTNDHSDFGHDRSRVIRMMSEHNQVRRITGPGPRTSSGITFMDGGAGYERGVPVRPRAAPSLDDKTLELIRQIEEQTGVEIRI